MTIRLFEPNGGNTKVKTRSLIHSDERIYVLIDYKICHIDNELRSLVNANHSLNHCSTVHRIKQDIKEVQSLIKTYYIYTHK